MAQQKVIPLVPGVDWTDLVEPGEAFRFTTDPQAATHSTAKPKKQTSKENASKSSGVRLTKVSDLDTLMTPAEVADKLKVDRSSVYEWIYEGKLKALTVGRHLRVPLCSVLEFIGA